MEDEQATSENVHEVGSMSLSSQHPEGWKYDDSSCISFAVTDGSTHKQIPIPRSQPGLDDTVGVPDQEHETESWWGSRVDFQLS